MAGTYELQLTPDLPDSLSPGELGRLRRYLAEEGGRQT
ncbi:hypothetical protein QFZ82_001711 [Streptomyces sp. V4I23]|nr:hypothetical protein [Streptomyces sp. V4I23]